MTKETAAALAEEIGFKGRGIFETKDLNFLKEVRDMCKANKCGNYGRLWTCPPACGTLADSRKKAKQFKWGIVLQTTAQMEDEFDGEAIEEELFCPWEAEDADSSVRAAPIRMRPAAFPTGHLLQWKPTDCWSRTYAKARIRPIITEETLLLLRAVYCSDKIKMSPFRIGPGLRLVTR